MEILHSCNLLDEHNPCLDKALSNQQCSRSPSMGLLGKVYVLLLPDDKRRRMARRLGVIAAAIIQPRPRIPINVAEI